MSEQKNSNETGFEDLYRLITNKDLRQKFMEGIDNEQYDYDQFSEMVNDNEFEEFLDEYDINTPKLKDILINYFTKSKKVVLTGELFIKKINDAYIANTGRLNSNVKLKDFGLEFDDDKSYNNIMILSINNGLPNILGTCGDNYTRWYINQFLNGKPNVTVAEWAQKMKLTGNNGSAFEAGMKAYFNRINACIALKPFHYINEDINEFAKLVLKIFDGVSNIVSINSKNKNQFPSQLDFAILPKISESGNDDEKKNNDSDDSDSNDDDKNDDDNKDIDLSKAFKHFKHDDIYSEYIEFNEANYDLTRPVQAIFKIPVQDDIRGKRFAYIIDKKNVYNNNKNFYSFRPKEFHTIQGNAPRESYSINSKYIIKPDNNKGIFGLLDSKVFGLSFHLISQDTIKCYQYWAKGMSRFIINDIKKLWPHMFCRRNNKKQKITIDIDLQKNILTNDDIYPKLTE